MSIFEILLPSNSEIYKSFPFNANLTGLFNPVMTFFIEILVSVIFIFEILFPFDSAM